MENWAGWLTVIVVLAFGFQTLKCLDKVIEELKGLRLALYEINARSKKREDGPDPYEDICE